MKCPHCQAELKRGTATFTENRNSYVLILEDIPAWICVQCGEPLFDSDVVRGIQDVLHAIDERVTNLRKVA